MKAGFKNPLPPVTCLHRKLKARTLKRRCRFSSSDFRRIPAHSGEQPTQPSSSTSSFIPAGLQQETATRTATGFLLPPAVSILSVDPTPTRHPPASRDSDKQPSPSLVSCASEFHHQLQSPRFACCRKKGIAGSLPSPISWSLLGKFPCSGLVFGY